MTCQTQPTDLPAHRFWPAHGDIRIDATSALECQDFLDKVLLQVNEVLEKEGLQVQFLAHLPNQPIPEGIDPMRNLLFSLHEGSQAEPIDIFDLKALDEVSLKPLALAVEEMIAKMHQHRAAKKTDGIIFSASGSKFDLRKLENCVVAIDEKGYLTIQGKRIVISATAEQVVPLKAERLRSYTILRVIEEADGRIRLCDDYDFIRTNGRGMYIDSAAVHTCALETIASDFRTDAEGYGTAYLEIGRDQLTPSLKSHLFEKILEFSTP